MLWSEDNAFLAFGCGAIPVFYCILFWETDRTASRWLELASDSFVLALNEARDQS